MPFLKTSLRRYAAILIFLVGQFLCITFGLTAQTPAAPEYQIKAVFLFNFAQFIDWPPSAFSDAQSPLVIGVLGEDPFGNFLDELVRDEKVNNRPLEIQRYRRVEQIKTCHILFVSHSEGPNLDEIFSALKGRSILTVGDIEGFASHGGMIRFVNEKNKIRLRINLDASKAAALTISSKLLRPAEIITNGED
jgi:hypothetical protein